MKILDRIKFLNFKCVSVKEVSVIKDVIENDNVTFALIRKEILKNVEHRLEWLKLFWEEKIFTPEKLYTKEQPSPDISQFIHTCVRDEKNFEEKYYDLIDTISNDLIKYRKIKKNRSNFFIDQDVLQIVFSLPKKYIKLKHVNFLKTIITSVDSEVLLNTSVMGEILKKIINNKKLLIRFFKIVLQPIPNKDGSLQSIIDSYTFFSTIKNNISTLKAKYSFEIYSIVKKIISELSENSTFCKSFVPSIKNIEEGYYDNEYKGLLLYLAKEMLLGIEDGKLIEIVKELLNSKNMLFKRYALFVISEKYDVLGNLLWEYFKNQQVLKKNPLNDFELQDELIELFEKHCNLIEQKGKLQFLVDLIENLKSRKNDEVEDAYFRSFWLEPFCELGNDQINKLNSGYLAIRDEYEKKKEKETSIISSYPSSKKNESSKLFEGTVEEIVSNLESKHEEVEKLGKSIAYYDYDYGFQKSIKIDPEKYFKHLELFNNVHIVFKIRILMAFESIHREKGSLPWPKLIIFIKNMIETEKWKEKSEEVRSNKIRAIKYIADLINGACARDHYTFKEKELPDVRMILAKILDLAEPQVNVGKSGYGLMTDILNCPLGKIFSAIINLSLQIVRKNPESAKLEDRWDAALKKLIDDEINNKERTVELSYTLGRYLSNFGYLDEKWILDNLKNNKIFLKDEEHWFACWIGYLQSTRLFRNLYEKFIKLEFYDKALDTDFSDSFPRQRIIEHICLAYLEKFCDGDTSMLDRLILNCKEEEIIRISNFFRTSGERRDKKLLIDAWQKLFDLIDSETEDKEKYKKLANSLIMWIERFNSEEAKKMLPQLKILATNLH